MDRLQVWLGGAIRDVLEIFLGPLVWRFPAGGH